MEGQIELLEYLDNIETPQSKIESILDEVKRNLEAKGHPSGWVSETVNTEGASAFFLKSGRTLYKSDCPNFEGYWLQGGIGSVQCKCGGLLPSVIFNKLCKPNGKCPYREEAEKAAGLEKEGVAV